MRQYLQATRFIDSEHPLVMRFADAHRGADADPRQQAVALYNAVRDEIRYNPYSFSSDPQTLKASHALVASWSRNHSDLSGCIYALSPLLTRFSLMRCVQP